jgi:hypothetical protein
MNNENNAIPAPVERLDGRALDVLETCRAYEYYYDAYYGPDAPFSDQRPEPSSVAEALQDLCQAVPGVIRALESQRDEAVRLLRALVGEHGFMQYSMTLNHHEECTAFLAGLPPIARDHRAPEGRSGASTCWADSPITETNTKEK